MHSNIDQKAADNLRILSAAMVEKAQSGHPGGPMSAADFMHILYADFLRYDPDDMTWPFRDRFFLDPGHLSALLYSTLSVQGKYSMDELKQFRQWKSPTPGHPEVDLERGVENTSGPLGMGHAFAVGAAIAEKFMVERFGDWMSHKIYTLISDGGIQEEISHGAARIAGFLGLNNLIMFYDSNEVQLSTYTDAVSSEDTAKRYESWNWRVMRINGHDHQQIRHALKEANKEEDKPVLIIANTIMGKGAVDEQGQSYERRVELHGKPLSKAGASFEKTVKNLGGYPGDPFMILPEVKEHYEQINSRKREEAAAFRQVHEQWKKDNPELAGKLKRFLKLRLPEFDFESLRPSQNDSTRGASGYILSRLVNKIENMVVASADLSGSDQTAGFLKGTTPFVKGNFSGAFLNAGVSELSMAAVMNGMALHGGIIPVCGTFFVFSDYMKPAVRLAALMELPIIYVWSHDSFRVGEDGPTHQPIEQEAQIRLLEQVKNHSGENSLLALRPADGAETITAWRMALQNRQTPTALIFTRQRIKDLPPAFNQTRIQEAGKSVQGAYILYEPTEKVDLVLVGNGSEVYMLYEVAQILDNRKKIHARLVSAISEGLFRSQPEEYQKRVIPDDIPVFGVTAGLPVTLQNLVGPRGEVYGMTHFGYSAPAHVLDEKFGFTPDKIVQKVEQFMARQGK
jgi:transketolase